MIDVLATGERILQATLNGVAGGWVRFTQGATTVRLRANFGPSNPGEILGENGEVAIVQRPESISILAADLVDDAGQALRPKAGNTVLLEETGETLEVIPGPRDTAYDWASMRRIRMIIHLDPLT